MPRTLCPGHVVTRNPAAGQEDWVRVTGKCIVTGKEYFVRAHPFDLERWLHGEVIQKAMPYLSDDDREFLMTGYSPEGWELDGLNDDDDDVLDHAAGLDLGEPYDDPLHTAFDDMDRSFYKPDY